MNPEDNPISNTLAPTESGPSFDALVRDRDSLRMEVIELRKSLEEIQSKNDDEREKLQESLKSVRAEKENAEHRFRELLGKVNTIKSQLGERLKADAVCFVLNVSYLRIVHILINLCRRNLRNADNKSWSLRSKTLL